MMNGPVFSSSPSERCNQQDREARRRKWEKFSREDTDEKRKKELRGGF
jgi:hypothetical protein